MNRYGSWPYQTVTMTSQVLSSSSALMLAVTPIFVKREHDLLSLNNHKDSVGDLVHGIPSLNTNRLNNAGCGENQETLVC